ncbi:MAG: isochorismatase family cysteine hydrolase [Clostridia bacterium]|nr:isochorismatase family cysteine hydrolase [Clostridia bacterium]
MKKLLLVIDMQNDFVSGSLGTREARAIVPEVAGLMRRASQEGAVVILTLDTHGEDYLDTREGKALPVRHCIEGEWGHELCDEIKAELTDDMRTVCKPTFGCVALMGILFPLVDAETEIELCGLCTDICVVSNALLVKALYPENRISVHARACAGVTPESHEAALATMRMCQIEIVK